MWVKDFNKWNILKRALDRKKVTISFKEGEIWWCSIGQNVGSEIYGKGEYFRRPVLVFKKISDQSCIVVPLTTKGHSGSWYIPLKSGDRQAWAILHQLRLISTYRFDTKISMINKDNFLKIKKSLAKLLGFFPLSPD